MKALADTIVAPVTAWGRGAVAVLRVSGPRAFDVGRSVFQPWPDRPESHRAYYGRFSNSDDGLVLVFQEGQGYTGDATVEMNVHGSVASVRTLMDLCLDAGCRLAEPGEFTYRAFMNGRMDLTQAEAVRSLVEASTASQLQEAALRRDGALRRKLERLRECLVGLQAETEARIDFSEELGELDEASTLAVVSDCRDEIQRLLSTARAGSVLRRGFRVALVGRPNAGKSSLLNALLGRDRAIVSEMAGTTRDFIEEPADIHGVPVLLTDTAGLRVTDDPVERQGVERAFECARSADLVLYLHESGNWSSEDSILWTKLPSAEIVATKCDLAASTKGIATSAMTGLGLDAVGRLISEKAGIADQLDATIEPRHEQLLRDADSALQLAENAVSDHLTTDLLATALASATRSLGRIVGTEPDADLIDQVFSTFCIGK